MCVPSAIVHQGAFQFSLKTEEQESVPVEGRCSQHLPLHVSWLHVSSASVVLLCSLFSAPCIYVWLYISTYPLLVGSLIPVLSPGDRKSCAPRSALDNQSKSFSRRLRASGSQQGQQEHQQVRVFELSESFLVVVEGTAREPKQKHAQSGQSPKRNCIEGSVSVSGAQGNLSGSRIRSLQSQKCCKIET